MIENWLATEVDKLEKALALKGLGEPGLHLRTHSQIVLQHALMRGYTTREYHAVMAAYHQRQLQREEALSR